MLSPSTRFHPFPSIGRLEEVSTQVNGPHHDPAVTKVVRFRGTVKLHGTHGDVVGVERQRQVTTTTEDTVPGVQLPSVHLHAQSRNRVVTLSNDNMGFAAFVAAREATFRDIVGRVLLLFTHPSDVHPTSPPSTVVLAGELCGGDVQGDGIGLSRLPRMFVIVAVKVGGCWRDMSHAALAACLPRAGGLDGVHSVLTFMTFHLDVDFGSPASVREGLQAAHRVCSEVQGTCPVCVQLSCGPPESSSSSVGSEDAPRGEGVVWVPTRPGIASNSRYWFKTQGTARLQEQGPEPDRRPRPTTQTTRHVQTGAVTDEVKAHLDECTVARCPQGLEFLRETVLSSECAPDAPVEKRHLHTFVQWVGQDVWREERQLTLVPLGVTETVARRLVAVRATAWWHNRFPEL